MRKLILILALALMLCSCVDAATKVGQDRLNWSQSIDGIKFSGTAPASTTGKLYSDGGILEFDGQWAASGADIVISPVKGDYITDGTNDIVQFNAAWDELKAAGGGRVFIDEGNYDLGGIWLINNSVDPVPWQIVGSGHAAKIIGSSTVLMIKNGVMGIKKCSISNICISGPSEASPATVGIDHNGTECETNLYNVKFLNCTTGVDFVSPASYNLRIDNCLMESCQIGITLKGQNNVLNGVISGYEPLAGTSYGIKVEGETHGNTLISCDGGSANNGIRLYGTGNTAINCWYDENTGTALKTTGASTRITGGFFPTGSIVEIGTGAHYSILDHVFSYNGRPSIVIASGVVGTQMMDAYFSDYSSKISDLGTYSGFSVPGQMAASSPGLGGIRGMVIWNSAAAASGTPGWVCTTTGVEGSAVWKALANLAA